ncbi:inositol monophosphatase family protein [Alsobacter sp. R-9]
MGDTGGDWREELAAAEAIGREAGDLMRRRFLARTPGTFSLKGQQDYLTETDGEVERMVAARLAERFPGDGLIGEEGASRPGERLWIVDPIDGTANFARGISHFCISVALVAGGRPVVGVIYDPMLDEMFAARLGGGATLNGRPMAVSGLASMTNASVECGWSLRVPMETYHAMIRRITDRGAGLYRMGSGALGMAYVAAGRIDGYCELHINAWDVLAGVLLVEEAGGRCSAFLAGNGLREGNPILGSTPALFDTLSELTGIR